MPRTFPCPRCGEPVFGKVMNFARFCSERCKLIDLGAWANDEYRLPTQDAPQQDKGSRMKMIMRINPLFTCDKRVKLFFIANGTHWSMPEINWVFIW